ncbi:MAG: ribosome biogenesis GTPase YlqF [Solobacterium sp.]|nr:ribosome biogenesis GTPase YlqF [Solobacterium sp.]
MSENKTTINWYPGHMEKARRDMAEHLKAADMVIEIRDARIPRASKNPVLDQLIGERPRMIILSKADLADPEKTQEWIRALKSDSQDVLALDLAHDSTAKKQIIDACMKLTEPKRRKMISRGIRPRAMRAMVCGIPNSGKSTMINRIAGKSVAKTEDKPGVTRSLSWIHCGKTLDILDTPGVLWPKFDDHKTAVFLAATGAIKEDILDLKEITGVTIDEICHLYPGTLEKEYGMDEQSSREDKLKKIAESRNLRKENDLPDEERAAILFLREFRRGKTGRLTLENTDEKEQDLSE